MEVSTLPRRPVENWEAVRDEWVAAVERIVDDAEAWATRAAMARPSRPEADHRGSDRVLRGPRC